ncbi:hypothetical protein [Catellatospora methionotrophica]|uniref:hypothetical protein n=1 Tax=Catellatospora methionotrophica TaxID=121620 RepID=UPI003410D7DB
MPAMGFPGGRCGRQVFVQLLLVARLPCGSTEARYGVPVPVGAIVSWMPASTWAAVIARRICAEPVLIS